MIDETLLPLFTKLGKELTDYETAIAAGKPCPPLNILEYQAKQVLENLQTAPAEIQQQALPALKVLIDRLDQLAAQMQNKNA